MINYLAPGHVVVILHDHDMYVSKGSEEWYLHTGKDWKTTPFKTTINFFFFFKN